MHMPQCLLFPLKGNQDRHPAMFFVSLHITLYLAQNLVHYSYLGNVHWKKFPKPEVQIALAYRVAPRLSRPCCQRSSRSWSIPWSLSQLALLTAILFVFIFLMFMVATEWLWTSTPNLTVYHLVLIGSYVKGQFLLLVLWSQPNHSLSEGRGHDTCS